MSSNSEKAARIRQLLDTEREAVGENTRGFNRGRYESIGRLDDAEQYREQARQIKEDAIEHLPDLIDEVTETVESNGGTVYVADDTADANEYIAEVCTDRDAERVVKSKSMTSEELEINAHLESLDIDVVETDLGEWVLQVAEEAPSHIVAPAIHKSREEIARLFTEQFDPDEPLETAEQLTAFARKRLGKQLREADVGMTGANFVTADTGTMALVTSEGNARKTIAATDTHVAVAGVEKLIPSVSDLRPFVELIARSGTGQDITSYVSLLTPPMESPTLDFDDETPLTDRETERDFHLVLVDNGRLAMREDDQLRETLYCIRCSACSNTCANFQEVGGHAFGGETYSGGIATGWETGVHGIESAAEFNDLCTGCSRCVPACPVKIDIPWINTVVRNRINSDESVPMDVLVDGLTPDVESQGPGLQKRLFGNFETLARLGSALAPISNWLASTPPSGWLLERTAGVDDRRDLPAFQRTTLVEWANDRKSATADSRSDSETDRRVVLYPDVYTNYVAIERGKAAVQVLEALGVEVVVPSVGGSGRAPLSQGMIATASAKAQHVVETLDDISGDVVVVEPSALAMFRSEYDRLVDDNTLAARSYELMEYVYGLLEKGADADVLSTAGDGADTPSTAEESVAYHSHCQQRTLELATYTVAVLEECGYDVTTTDVECCGMAGSFGYKEQYYDLSMAVGDRLVEQIPAEAGHVVASGTSCTDQLDDLLTEEPLHPAELLAPEE